MGPNWQLNLVELWPSLTHKNARANMILISTGFHFTDTNVLPLSESLLAPTRTVRCRNLISNVTTKRGRKFLDWTVRNCELRRPIAAVAHLCLYSKAWLCVAYVVSLLQYTLRWEHELLSLTHALLSLQFYAYLQLWRNTHASFSSYCRVYRSNQLTHSV